MFTSDGAAKQNMQTLSLPYHSGELGNNRMKLRINCAFIYAMTTANDLTVFFVCFFLYLIIYRWHQHIPRFILSHLAPDQFRVTNSDPACACYASLRQSGAELQSKDTWYVGIVTWSECSTCSTTRNTRLLFAPVYASLMRMKILMLTHAMKHYLLCPAVTNETNQITFLKNRYKRLLYILIV